MTESCTQQLILWAEQEPLSNEQHILISKIILNWGRSDSNFSNSIDILYKLTVDDSRDLLFALSTEKKINLLKKKTKERSDPDLKHALSEASYCLNHYQPQRNLIAHGMIGYDQSGKPSFISFRSDEFMPLTELDSALEKSRYIASISNYVTMKLLELDTPPLRKRPG